MQGALEEQALLACTELVEGITVAAVVIGAALTVWLARQLTETRPPVS